MFDVLVSVRDPATRDGLRAALTERGVFRSAAAERGRLIDLLMPPSETTLVLLDLDPNADADRAFLAALRAVNDRVQFVAVGPRAERPAFGPSRLELDVRTFLRTPLDPFDVALRLKRLAESLAPSGV